MSPEIRILADAAELSRAAAAEFARLAGEAVRAGGRFTVALAGGSTPRDAYTLLAEDPSLRNQIPWDRTHCFWGDERPVPPDHPESNYCMAGEAMLSKVPIPQENVHRIRGESRDTARAAQEYERTLRDFFQLPKEEFPRFDLVLLGLGPDAHTASLFPGTRALRERRRLAVSNWVEQLDTERITLTPPVLNGAACVIFLVSGEEKATALKAVLEGKPDPDRLPAQMIRPERGALIWLVDRAATHLLEHHGRP
jgi:6-phosphogluconolactonase